MKDVQSIINDLFHTLLLQPRSVFALISDTNIYFSLDVLDQRERGGEGGSWAETKNKKLNLCQ